MTNALKPKTPSAFTLVEMLLVIIVFWIWVLAVLYGISQTLKTQDRTESMITASFLAREGIELMYSLRDSNYAKSQPRNCIFQNGNHCWEIEWKDNWKYFTSWTILKIALWTWQNHIFAEEAWPLATDFETNFNNFQLFYLTWKDNPQFSYFYTWDWWQPLRYARYILLKPITDKWKTLDTSQILKIESHVLFKKSALTWDFIMESFIGNY